MQADDLCLIIACERGDESAWNDLVERFTATVRSAARSASKNEDAAEDLAQSIWAELYGLRTRKDGCRQANSLLLGRGSLAGWLRAVVAQLAVDVFRKQSRLSANGRRHGISSGSHASRKAIRLLREYRRRKSRSRIASRRLTCNRRSTSLCRSCRQKIDYW